MQRRSWMTYEDMVGENPHRRPQGSEPEQEDLFKGCADQRPQHSLREHYKQKQQSLHLTEQQTCLPT